VTEPLHLPPPVRRYLETLIETRFGERDPRPVIGALPAALPAGTVTRLAGGGPFGWLIDARLDELDGRLVLECLEDSRMAGPDHYRVHDDGTREDLPSERTGYSHPTGASPEEVERVRAAFHEHNRAVQALLRERGFFGGAVDSARRQA
jgi:hypothetical protein